MSGAGVAANARSRFWTNGRRIERAGYLAGALLIASGLAHVAILIIGGNTWEGPVSLRKAVTFGLSFGSTLITIAWVSSFLHLRERTRTLLLGLFGIACLVETGLVSLQAWRGVPSHFNLETTFDGLVARALAGGGVVLVAIIVILTVQSFRTQPGLSFSLRIAIRSGFVLLLGSMLIGAAMIAKGMTLVLGGHAATAYATAGALKPSHAVMMHGILVLPLLAWMLSLTGWTERSQRTVVVLATAGYIILAGVITTLNVAAVDPLAGLSQ